MCTDNGDSVALRTLLASPAFVAGRLTQCFDEDDSFKEKVCASMLEKMKELITNQEQECTHQLESPFCTTIRLEI